MVPSKSIRELPTESVYVTRTAAKVYASVVDTGLEEARRELTALLSDGTARQKEPETDEAPALYRHRSRSTGLDISARVTHEGPLHTVVAVSVRPY